jgi:hypothetical protein
VTSLPTSLVRFERELELAIHRDRTRQRRRFVLRSAIAVAAAAAVALGALGALPRTGPSVVDRAAAALRGSGGTILHTVLVGTLAGGGQETAVRIETWQSSSPPYDQLQIIDRGGIRLEYATMNGVDQLYDPQTNTIYTASAQPKDAEPIDKPGTAKAKADAVNVGASVKRAAAIVSDGDRYRAKILGLLESGRVHEDGRVTVDGRAAIRLVSDDGNVVLLVDADTYQPIEWRVNEGGQAAVTSFPTYEHLPVTDANTALLNMRGRHPNATVDNDPAHYRAALERLNPKVR